MLSPHNMAIGQLSQEEGISEGTLYNWRAEARGKGQLLPDAAAGAVSRHAPLGVHRRGARRPCCHDLCATRRLEAGGEMIAAFLGRIVASPVVRPALRYC